MGVGFGNQAEQLLRDLPAPAVCLRKGSDLFDWPDVAQATGEDEVGMGHLLDRLQGQPDLARRRRLRLLQPRQEGIEQRPGVGWLGRAISTTALLRQLRLLTLRRQNVSPSRELPGTRSP